MISFFEFFDLIKSIVRKAQAREVLVPNVADGHKLEFLVKIHYLCEVIFVLQSPELTVWHKERREQRLLHRANAGDPGRKAVDACIKVYGHTSPILDTVSLYPLLQILSSTISNFIYTFLMYINDRRANSRVLRRTTVCGAYLI